MPEIFINYADEMIVGVFLWGSGLIGRQIYFRSEKLPYAKKSHKGAFFVMLIRRCKARSRSGHLS